MNAIPVVTPCAAAVVLRVLPERSQMLLLKRVKGGYWSHVTGGIEAGEAAWQTVVREVREETCLEVESLYTAGHLDQFYEPLSNRILIVPVFVAICAGDAAVQLNEEHTDYRWCELEEACDLVPYPNQRDVYRAVWRNFVERRPSEHQRLALEG